MEVLGAHTTLAHFIPNSSKSGRGRTTVPIKWKFEWAEFPKVWYKGLALEMISTVTSFASSFTLYMIEE